MNVSPITKVFETVRDSLRGVIADYGDGAPQPVHELGAEHIAMVEKRLGTGQAKPSIVWDPLGGPAKLQGNLKSATSIKDPAGVKNPRQLMTVENAIDVYFWTASIDETWWLFSHWLHVARTALTAYSLNEPMGISWSAIGEPNARRGTFLVYRFHLAIPVTFEPVPFVKPTGVSITGEIVPPSQITTPQGEEMPS